MTVNLLRDADIRAISLVGKGANRKRFFLFKAEGEEEAKPLPAGRLLKAADWSTVYCVVAEPGAHEDSGMGGPDVEDRWADSEEIRKAAHRFMANGGLINKLHEDLEPFGQLVENAVALADFEVNGETIRKGSWYIAVTPSADGKAAIEKGEFTGVSIEGTAIREEVEKRDERTEDPRGSTPAPPTVGRVEKGLLRKIAEKVGLAPEEIAALEEVEKADRTFGELIAQREFDKLLPEAFDAFRDSVWNAFFPYDSESADAVALITESCDEFKAWALKQLESVPVEKSERAEALGVELDPEGSTRQTRTTEDEMSLSDAERQEFDALKKEVAELPSKLTGEIAKALGAKVGDDEPVTAESIAKRLEGLKDKDGDDLATEVAKLREDVAKLAEGSSSQSDDSTPPAPTEAEARQKVEKAFEESGLPAGLVGVI